MYYFFEYMIKIIIIYLFDIFTVRIVFYIIVSIEFCWIILSHKTYCNGIIRSNSQVCVHTLKRALILYIIFCIFYHILTLNG